MPQDGFLFDPTVAEHVRYGRVDTPPADVAVAVDEAAAAASAAASAAAAAASTPLDAGLSEREARKMRVCLQKNHWTVRRNANYR